MTATIWPERVRSLDLSPTRRLDPEAIAVDDEAIYFTSDEAVFRVDKTTAELQELDKVSGSFALSLAVDEHHVYWVSRGVSPWVKSARKYNECDLRRVPRGGGNSEVIARDQRGIQAILLVGETMYWANEETPEDVWDCRIVTCPKRGGALEELASGLLFPAGRAPYLAPLADRLYASIVPDRATWPSDEGWAIATLPRAGGQVDVAMVGVDADTGLASDGEYVYFVDWRSNSVLRLSADGQAFQLVIDPPDRQSGRATATWQKAYALPDEPPFLSAVKHGLGRLWHLITDGKGLYVLTERPIDPGRISMQAVIRVPREGGVVEELAAWPSRWSVKVACDGAYIYCNVRDQDGGHFLGRIPT